MQDDFAKEECTAAVTEDGDPTLLSTGSFSAPEL